MEIAEREHFNLKLIHFCLTRNRWSPGADDEAIKSNLSQCLISSLAA